MNPKKVLVVKLRSLGDTVLMTAPLRELKKHYPNAEIHVAGRLPWTELLEKDPAISKLWTYQYHRDRASRAKAIARLALQLRKERFDLVVNFHASPSSGMLSFSTGAKVRAVHFHGHKDRNRYSTVEIPGKGVLKPVIERDMDTIRALGLKVPAGELPQLYLTSEELFQSAQDLINKGYQGPLLALGLGASRSTKLWPMERFAWVTEEYLKRTSGSVFVIAAKDEGNLIQEYLDALPESVAREKILVASQWPLRKVASFLSQCQVFLGNDSGPKHIAVAVGLPTITLFGPEDPFEWHPYPQDRHPYFFLEKLDCRRDASPGMPAWCGLHVCTTEKHKCMKAIEPQPVLEKVLSFVST